MRRLLLILLVFAVTSCSRYERPESVPSYGDYWIDAPLARQQEQQLASLQSALEDLFPVVADEVCAPGLEGEARETTSKLCDVSDACVELLAASAAPRLMQDYQGLPPDDQVFIVDMRIQAMRHAESVLVSGLTRNEMYEVMIASCPGSPTHENAPKAPEGMFQPGTVADVCNLDWRFLELSVAALRHGRASTARAEECAIR